MKSKAACIRELQHHGSHDGKSRVAHPHHKKILETKKPLRGCRKQYNDIPPAWVRRCVDMPNFWLLCSSPDTPRSHPGCGAMGSRPICCCRTRFVCVGTLSERVCLRPSAHHTKFPRQSLDLRPPSFLLLCLSSMSNVAKYYSVVETRYGLRDRPRPYLSLVYLF